MSTPNVSQEAEKLRASRELRAVTSAEEGSDIFKLPAGVYGFTSSPAFREIPVYAVCKYQQFEVHRLKDGAIHILGFVRPDEKARIDKGKESVDLLLFPAPYTQATAFVSFNVNSITPAKKAITREDGNPFRTTVHPV